MNHQNLELKKAVKFLEKDHILRNIIQKVGPCKIRVIKNRYEALVDAIITQQISDAAGKTITKQFREIFSGFPKPWQVLNVTDSVLRSSGISKMKAEYIMDISKKIESRELNFKEISIKNNEEIISELTQIRGVGRWTAEMFLIFGLGRLDILPLGDLGLRKGIQLMYSMPKMPDEEKIIKIASKWRPYRTVATWYIWKGVRQFKNV